MFSWDDIADAMAGCIAAPVFSLDPINNEAAPHHPLQAMKFAPNALRSTSMLATMFYADYLLKFFTCGAEVSASPPFPLRPVDTAGLLHGLPAELVQALTICSRAHNAAGESVQAAHRFWVDVGDMQYDVKESATTGLSVSFGNVNMRIKTHMLRKNPRTGELEDAPVDTDDQSPEGRFAAGVTSKFELLARHFPVFARLRELAKICAAIRLMDGFRKGIREQLEATRRSAPQDLRQALNDGLTAPAGYPFAQNESKISEIIEDNIRQQSIPYYQHSEARRQLRPQVIRALRETDAEVITGLSSSLASQFGCSAHSLQYAVRRFVEGCVCCNQWNSIDVAVHFKFCDEHIGMVLDR